MSIKTCLLLILTSFLLYAPASAGKSLAAGYNVSCVIKSGNVMCWGANEYMQLGDGTTTANRYVPAPVLGLAGDAVAVSVGLYHACALTAAGGVKCWGANGEGQLGDGTNTDRATAVSVTGLESGVQAISAGFFHTCALTDAGAVLCWGNNANGQLGDGTTDNHLSPTQVSGLESGLKAITTGGWGSCALTTSGGVFCWGDNQVGSVGDGVETQTPRYLPTQVQGLTSGIAAIASGLSHSCALSTQGAVSCWGGNESGELGDQSQTFRYAPVSVVGLAGPQVAVTGGWNHTCSINSVGAAHCWGSNAFGQIGAGMSWAWMTGVPPVPVFHLPWRVTELAAGANHSCALVNNGAVFCWGSNIEGALGIRIVGNQFSPQRVNGLYVPRTTWHPPPR